MMYHISHHVTNKEVLQDLNQQTYSPTLGSPKYHPELSAVMAKTPTYKGLQFDVVQMKWVVIGTGQYFDTEFEAAKQAYAFKVKTQVKSPLKPIPKSPLTSSSSSPKSVMGTTTFSQEEQVLVVSYKDETDDEKSFRRTRQLVQFYEYWDADRPDIQGHVENMFKRHNFTNISRAVMTKFGVLPPGWEDELQQLG
jgi:hypothetical protein